MEQRRIYIKNRSLRQLQYSLRQFNINNSFELFQLERGRNYCLIYSLRRLIHLNNSLELFWRKLKEERGRMERGSSFLIGGELPCA